MAATRINGHAEEWSMTGASKCNCCPYGFHIDLGFVDFIENVANETSTVTTTNDRNDLQRNSLKHMSDQDNTANNSKQLIERISFNPSPHTKCFIKSEELVGDKTSPVERLKLTSLILLSTAWDLFKLFDKTTYSSLFSDSLENVVSDFEETLNLRESNSERGSRHPLNNARKNIQCNGYFSDYGTMQSSNRLLPPKMR
uniref:Uncharacterized protein n=1 Tax=Loa loa TaxID=7209 RepID=A0A1I7VKZ7_LOALO